MRCLGEFETNGGNHKQAMPTLSVQITLVAEQDAVVKLDFSFIEVMNIECRCILKLKGFDRSLECAHRMNLIAQIMRLVHRTITITRICGIGLLANTEAVGNFLNK